MICAQSYTFLSIAPRKNLDYFLNVKKKAFA